MIPSVQKYIYDNEDIRNDYEIMLNYLESVEHNLNIEKAKLMVNMGKKDFNEPVPSKIFEAYRLILGQFEIFNFNFNKVIRPINFFHNFQLIFHLLISLMMNLLDY